MPAPCSRKSAIEFAPDRALKFIMTIVAKRRQSQVELVFLSVAFSVLMVLSGCETSHSPSVANPNAAIPFIKVAHTSNGYFFQRGTNLFYSLGVCVVIPEETWPDRPEFGGRKALGSYDGLSRFKSDTQAWARATAARLESWGFNTAGAWCERGIIPTAHVSLARRMVLRAVAQE